MLYEAGLEGFLDRFDSMRATTAENFSIFPTNLLWLASYK